MYDKHRIEFENFKPTDLERGFAQRSVEKILLRSPSDSSVKFQIRKDGPNYKGSWQVKSLARLFSTHSEGESLEEVVYAMESHLLSQLSQWIKERNLSHNIAI